MGGRVKRAPTRAPGISGITAVGENRSTSSEPVRRFPAISPAVPVNRTVRVFCPVNAEVESVAVRPPGNATTVCWWSTTSLSEWNTHRPYGPRRSASIRPSGLGSSPSSATGQPSRPARAST